MDDYTWKRKLQQRRIRQRRRFGLFFLLLSALIAATVWYFFFYVRTPEYTLKQLTIAVEQRDAGAVRRYVNLDVLSSQIYDDLTVDLFAYDSTLTPATRVMFEKFYITIKPQLAGGLEQAALNRVETGVWGLPDGTDILKGRQLGIDFERFIERSQLRNTTWIRIGAIHHEGTSATADIEIVEDYTQTPFTLQVGLEQADDGRWQVSCIKNYRQYLDTIAPLQNGDIASYIDATQDIIDRYNSDFSAYQQRFSQLAKTSTGELSAAQRKTLAALIADEVIPSLKKRQQRLDETEVPPGAQYLARQRQQSTETTIKAWQHFLKGLRENRQSEFATAETLHKQELAIDLRIQDIIRHTAISRNIPNLP